MTGASDPDIIHSGRGNPSVQKRPRQITCDLDAVAGDDSSRGLAVCIHDVRRESR
jgi:hypothetical protein